MVTAKQAGEKDGKPVFWYYFENENGMKMTVTNFGATITSITAMDKNGGMADVALGLETIEEYLAGHPYLGSTAGRYANRIANGRFSLGGKEYQLAQNNGKNHLHGGPGGFARQVWDGNVEGDTLALSYTSADGEEGYPGTVKAQVRFTLTKDDAVDISYTATTDAATPLNLTNHTYFNLNGGTSPILEHTLWLDAARFTPTDEGLIPTGEIAPVAGTPLDFTRPRALGERIGETAFTPIRYAGGYDHNFVPDGRGFRKIAELSDPKSGRHMAAYTDQPGVQVYTAQSLPLGLKGSNGRVFGPFCGVCLETQAFPDSPNHPDFPGGVLRPGETYTHHTRYVFWSEG